MANGILRLNQVEPVVGSFTLDGDPYEPDSVTLTIRPPSGAAVVKVWPAATDILHDTVHEFLYEVEFDQRGPWEIEWLGVGTWTDENGNPRVYQQPVRQTYRVYA